MSKFSWIHAAPALAVLAVFAGCGQREAGAAARKAAPPIPVVGGVVEQRDTPIYLDGIGTVQAFNTVTVHAQVDGVLQKVAFREGQDVRAGDLLAVVDPRPYQAQLDQATAKKAEDEAQASGATTAYNRNNSLLQQGLMDHQTVDTEKATMDQFNATVQADEAAIEQQAVELGYTRIAAPIAGRVGLRLVDEGNVVHSTDAGGLVVITQLRPISVVFTLPQQNWPQIQQRVASGQELAVLAIGDSAQPIDRGTLSVVDNQIDATTGTIKLKAAFPNEKLALWPGQFVNVRLLMQTRRGGLVVPASVIQRGPQGSYAFVIGADSRVSPRLVTVAQIDGGYALIDQGLAAGERVVVDGQSKLQAGSTVTTAAAPAKPRK
jgi:multidrug efflux system membrane fusion protein